MGLNFGSPAAPLGGMLHKAPLVQTDRQTDRLVIVLGSHVRRELNLLRSWIAGRGPR